MKQKREKEVLHESPWTWRGERLAWSHFGDMAHEIVSVHGDGSTAVWRRVVFGLYRRISCTQD